MDKPIANYVQDTSVPGTTGAETTPSNNANVKAGETQWVNTRQWDKSSGITDKIIGETRKAIDDEFNNNVRRFMLSKHSEPQMTVKPQKRRTIQISNKWTEPVKARLPTPPKQMDSQKTVSRLRVNPSVFLFGTAATA